MTQPQNCCGRPAEERRYPGLDEAAQLFAALADESRLSILRQLREQGETCVCDLRACCDLAQPTISYHLKVLRDASLVLTDKRGVWVYYRLNHEKADALSALLP